MSTDYVDIPSVPISTVKRTLRNKLVAITDDVQGIAAALAAIDPSLHLHYDPHEAVYVVSQHRDGEERFVGAYPELDGRVLARVREITSERYSLADELEKSERAADKRHADAQRERLGDAGERLGHALRKDFDVKDRVFIPRTF
jgi:hypothetical protein